MPNVRLQYLFVAELSDGSVIEQTQEDCSKTDPARNCFYDILNTTVPVELFTLINQDDNRSFTVDLANGYFQADQGHWFKLHDDEELTNIRPVRFLRRRETLSMGDMKQTSEIKFVVGWQANLPDGSNIQRTITIA